MESSSMAKRLWHVVRAVYYMLRKGISKRKLMLDLHLLLRRGKLAGKAIGKLMTHHHAHGGAAAPSSSSSSIFDFSCRSADPYLSFYTPREVEFSCSNTPAFPSFHSAAKRKHRRRRHDDDDDSFDAAAVAMAFEILNTEAAGGSDAESVVASPLWSFGRSPAPVRQLRITDSPFPVRDEEGEADGRVDREAEEFIKRFYEQLRKQPAATPDYAHVPRARAPLLGRA